MKYLLLFFATSISLISFAQTGPGGVGTNDGTSTLNLWLRADTGVTVSGIRVTAWQDQSGYGNNADLIGGDPTVTTIINGHDVISLDGNDHFECGVNSNTGTTATIYVAATITGYSTTWAGIVTGALLVGVTYYPDFNSTERVAFLTSEDNTDNVISYRFGNRASIANALAGSSLKIMVSEYDGTNNIIRVNGSASSPVASSGNFNINLISIGKRITQNNYTIGDYAEVIYFSSALNSAQQIIIENYLAAKFNGALSAGTDLYDEDDPANGNYDYDVAGIGRIDAANLHDDSRGTGIVRILNPTGLDDNEFLFWGHDNCIQQATITSDVPAGIPARFCRVWRVSEVNTAGAAVDVGGIDMRWDLTGLGPVTASDLRLLVDTDNDGVFADETPIGGAGAVGGNIYQFAGVTAIANNLRFTLATINKVQTPLPIELVDFNAKVVDGNHVQLNWTTASEINNDYFTVEKSADSKKWHVVTTVKGAGNSNSTISYQSIDKTPYEGISYYRLKQTDFDGKYSYSDIINVNVRIPDNQVKIYPNPTSSIITILANKNELETINIYNVLGKDVTNQAVFMQKNNGKVMMDLSNLSAGTYYLKTKTTAHKVHKQ